MPGRELRHIGFTIAAGAAAIFVGAYALGVTLRPDGEYLRFQSNVLYNVPALAALIAAPFAIHRTDGRERAGWALVALTIVFWQIGDWGYAWYDYVGHRDVPFPGLLDLAYYAGFATLSIAIPLLTFPRQKLADRRWMIDAATIMLVAGVLAWEFVLRSVIDAGYATKFEVGVALGYPVLDLGLLGALLISVFASGRRVSRVAVVLGAAVLCQVAGDAAYTYVVNTNGYDPWGNPLEIGWVGAYALLGLAMLLPKEDERAAAPVHARPTLTGFIVSYATLIPVAVVVFSTQSSPSRLTAAGAVLAVALMVWRQVLSLRENVTLVDELDSSQAGLQEAVAHLEQSRTELVEKSQMLELALASEREQGRRDSLTGALNHGAIAEVLRNITVEGNDLTCAVVMADVNGMKATNDTFGHQVGDLVLIEVAGALMREDAVVGRYGGDEFIAVLPRANREVAQAYCDAVTAELRGGAITDPESGARVPLSISMGLAVYPDEGQTIADLVGLSDSAMYAAKRERPGAPDGIAMSREMGDERAARMVGELVPLLTSSGELNEKLRLVGHKLSVGAGYDAVNFVMVGDDRKLLALNAFARAPESELNAFQRMQARTANDKHPMVALLEKSGRPLIMHDLEHDPGLADGARKMLLGSGLKSLLVAPMVWKDRIVGVLAVGSKRERAFGPGDAAFLLTVATQVTAIARTSALVSDLKAASERLAASQAETVMMLAAAAEAHDRTTGMHLHSIRDLAESLARELGCEEEAVADLGLAAVLHDIGKVSVPDSVLSSSGKLAAADWDTMKEHTVWGSDFLSGRPGFALAASVARSHHERWDGSGYPDGLAGDAIPFAAQIVTVADSYDAMTHDRPYKAGRPIEEAVAEIVACSGSQFSPRVVDALLTLHERGELPLPHNDDDIEERDAA